MTGATILLWINFWKGTKPKRKTITKYILPEIAPRKFIWYSGTKLKWSLCLKNFVAFSMNRPLDKLRSLCSVFFTVHRICTQVCASEALSWGCNYPTGIKLFNNNYSIISCYFINLLSTYEQKWLRSFHLIYREFISSCK